MSTLVIKSYQEILNKLNPCELWLKSLNIPTSNSRLSEIIGYIDSLNSHYNNQTLPSLIEEVGNEKLWFALLESRAFITIHEAFLGLNQSRLPKKKLEEILKGPFLPTDEKPGDANVNARNCLFELELAARMKSSGFNVTGFDDIEFDYSNNKFNIQCKRLFSVRNMSYNINRAYEQLGGKLNNNAGKGIIALAIEKIEETDRYLLDVSSKQEGGNKVNQRIVSIIQKYGNLWHNFIDIRVIGVLICLKFISIIRDEGPLLASGFFIGCDPLCSNQSTQFYDRQLIENIARQLNKPVVIGNAPTIT